METTISYIIGFGLVAFIISVISIRICRRRYYKTRVIEHNGTPVTVTTTHVAASPIVVPPYPVDQLHPTPHVIGMGVPPPVSFAAPPIGLVGAYPPYVGYPPVSGAAPYPPVAPYTTGPAPQTAPPPSYSEAVAQPQPQMPQHEREAYAKQAAYNPNYQ